MLAGAEDAQRSPKGKEAADAGRLSRAAGSFRLGDRYVRHQVSANPSDMPDTKEVLPSSSFHGDNTSDMSDTMQRMAHHRPTVRPRMTGLTQSKCCHCRRPTALIYARLPAVSRDCMSQGVQGLECLFFMTVARMAINKGKVRFVRINSVSF